MESPFFGWSGGHKLFAAREGTAADFPIVKLSFLFPATIQVCSCDFSPLMWYKVWWYYGNLKSINREELN